MRLVSYLLCLFVLLVGCQQIEITPTATPAPTPEPSATPLGDGFTDCFGVFQVGFELVNTNQNACLDGEPRQVDLGTNDGRYVSLYPGYDYWQVAGDQNTLAYMNTEDVFFRGALRPAMILELTQIDGQFGVTFPQRYEPGVCYLIKQTGTAILRPANTDPRNIWLSGMIFSESGGTYELFPQQFPLLIGPYEIFWPVRGADTIAIQIETSTAIWTTVAEAGFTSGTQLYIHAVEVMEAPAGYCNPNDPRLVTIE